MSDATAASFDRRARRTRPSAITRQATPNGSVIAGPTVWPDGNPITTGPGKSANRSAITARAGRIARRLVAPRQLADDDRAARAEQAGLPQLRDHPIEPVRTLADFVEEQHVARRRRRTRTACRATPAAASACRRAACPRASPGRSVSSAGGASSPIGSRRHNARSNEIAIVARVAAAQPAGQHRPVKRDRCRSRSSETSGAR